MTRTAASGAVSARLERIRARIRTTSPDEASLRVMLVLAHEALSAGSDAESLDEPLTTSPAANATMSGTESRTSAEDYQSLVEHVCRIASDVIPSDARALVLSKGDQALLDLGCEAHHFPQGRNGGYAGHYPIDGTAAVAHLEHCQAAGAYDFVVIPATAYWWLDYYGELAQHLLSTGRVAHHSSECLIFDLRVRRASGLA